MDKSIQSATDYSFSVASEVCKDANFEPISH